MLNIELNGILLIDRMRFCVLVLAQPNPFDRQPLANFPSR